MKFIKVEISEKINAASSWIIYITRTQEEAESIQQLALTQKSMFSDDWFYSVSTSKVLEDCRVPEFFHGRDYWMTAIEHNNGDWKKEQKHELYIVE